MSFFHSLSFPEFWEWDVFIPFPFPNLAFFIWELELGIWSEMEDWYFFQFNNIQCRLYFFALSPTFVSMCLFRKIYDPYSAERRAHSHSQIFWRLLIQTHSIFWCDIDYEIIFRHCIFSFHSRSRSRSFLGMRDSSSHSRILGMDFFIPFPFPNFWNGLFLSLPVPKFWEWICLFPSCSQISDFFISFSFPNFENGIFSCPFPNS